jgi:hypothetical protein
MTGRAALRMLSAALAVARALPGLLTPNPGWVPPRRAVSVEHEPFSQLVRPLCPVTPPSLLSPPGDRGRRQHGSNLRHAVLRLSPGRSRPISSAGRRLAALSLSAWRDGFVANRRQPPEVLGEGVDTDPGRRCVSRHSSSLAYPQP